MSQKYLYIVDHFISFPQSEYGGLWNVIAEDDDECFDLIVAEDAETYTEYYVKLKENILKAQRFLLTDEYDSGVIEAFLT